jgi:hypothetical protein
VGLKNIVVDIVKAINPKNQPRDLTPSQAFRIISINAPTNI